MSEASVGDQPPVISQVPNPVPERSGYQRMLEIPEQAWEKLWVWGSERINPIVVKEVRQSLKSKQFTISFGLTLLAICLSIAGQIHSSIQAGLALLERHALRGGLLRRGGGHLRRRLLGGGRRLLGG